MASPSRFSAEELRATVSLAGIFGLRMFGLFIILPVLSLYAARLPGGDNHTLIGIALGAYGLTQALLQIPFGWMSDRYGRKPVIYFGLALFALGSLIAALASDVYLIILGRVVQGAGAISAAVIALTADITREDNRTKAMAVIGATIGLTFALSIVIAPVLNRWIGVPGIFALTGLLALAAMLVLRLAVPDGDAAAPATRSGLAADFARVLKNRELARLNFGIFALHAVLMALFVVVPFSLERLGLAGDHHWQVYLPVMLGSFVLMLPFIAMGDRARAQTGGFVAALALLAIGTAVIGYGQQSLWILCAGLVVFFTAFNALEASLPSMISKAAPAGTKGTAIGVYSSVQFLGTFFGAAGGGWLSQHYGARAVFVASTALALMWLGVALASRGANAEVMRLPTPQLGDGEALDLSRRLSALPGVREAIVVARERMAYLKIDRNVFDERRALSLLQGG